MQVVAGVSIRQRLVVSSVILVGTACAYASIRYDFAPTSIGDHPAVPVVYLLIAI